MIPLFGTDIVFIHAPTVYDFRKKPMFYGPVSDVVPSSPVFEMYPIGFMTMSSHLEAAGFRTRIVNLAVQMLDNRNLDVERLIEKLEAKVYAIDLHWMPHCHGAIEIAKIVKRYHPDAIVEFGGFSSSYFYKDLIARPYIDMVMRGDSTELPHVKLMQVLQDGGDLTALVPTIEISAGAALSPASGTPIDLSNGKSATYTVTAEDGTVNEYTVSVYGRAAYFYDFENWVEGDMYSDVFNPEGWATCNDAVALIKNMGPLFGHPSYKGEYPVRPTDEGVEGKGAIIESVYTSYGDMMGQTIPAVTSGTIFLGTFNAMAAMLDPMSTTQFGILFEDKPLAVTGWLKYTPGEDFYDENGNIIDQQDLGTVNAVLYEVSDESETLNGSNIYTSESICATGSFETAGLEDFTQFSFDLEYTKEYDPSKTYKLAVIFAASKEGNQYRAASGSIMVVDNVTIICE